MTSLTLDDKGIHQGQHAFAPSFLLRDELTQSNLVHVGGNLRRSGNTITHKGDVAPLALECDQGYTAEPDRIAIHAELGDLTGNDRELTLCFALPPHRGGLAWPASDRDP